MAEYNTDICKQIEDIIDRKKERGEFDGFLQAIRNSRYAYSAPSASWDDRLCYLDAPKTPYWNSEGDVICDTPFMGHPIGPTDSEITVVRVKRESINNVLDQYRDNNIESKIPGDGSYLLESPSLVNLVTLIGAKEQKKIVEESADPITNESYLVQLSSWESNACHSLNNISPSQTNVATSSKRKSRRLGRRKSKTNSQKSSAKSSKHSLRDKAANFIRKIFFWRKVSADEIIVRNFDNNDLMERTSRHDARSSATM